MGAASSAPVSLTGAMGGAGGGLSQGAGQLASSGGMAMADTGAELGMSGVQSALEAPQSIFPGEGLGAESFAPSYTGAGSDITSGGGFFSDGGVGTGTPQSSAPLQTGQAPNADMGSYFDYTPQEGGQGMMQAPEGGGYFDYAGADYSGGSPGQSSFMDKAGDFWDEYGENIKSMAGSGMSGGGGGGAGGSRMAPPTPPNMLSGWGSGYAPMASPLPTLDYFMGGQ